MIKMHRRILRAVTPLTMTALILTGCTSEASSISSAKGKEEGEGVVDTGFTLSTVGSYDSADTAVVLSTDETNKAVTFINMDTGKQYTLYYDGTTYVKDKHDGPMTISQIKAGDVVDVTFLKGKKQLASIKLSPEAWVYDDVYNYDLAGANGTASIGSQTYSLPKGVVVLSEGQRVDTAEVVSQDVVSVSGIDHKIYSINVDRGHGYLSLKNEQPLLGGWIEVGNSVIRQITEDMLLVVPEGEYQVTLLNNGISCVKNVTVERDKEVVLDVDDIEIPEDATGKILFSVTPENATVSVDGKPVDISKAVELSYGIHRVEASASGYDTLTKHIQVGSEYATISFKLEETRKEDRNSVSENSITREPWEDTYTPADVNSISDNSLSSVSDNTLRSSQSGTVEVHVKEWDTDKELSGVTVRLEIEDSDKKVTYTRSKESPCSFSKDKNAHKYRFILSKDGYKTKTFEPDLEDAKKDETVYFMLEKQGSSNQTNSSNTRISTNVISAIATAGTGCDLTSGTDANTDDAYVSSASSGNLWKAGKDKVNEAVTNAVQKVVGTEEIGSYYFRVADALKDVVALANGDYEATASVTVSKSGYREETIPVKVIIKNKAGDVSLKGQVNFSVTEGIWFTEFTVDDQDMSSALGPIELDYGIHTVSIKAEGYEDFTKEFEVNSEELTVPCELVPEGSGEVEVSFWINSGEEFISNVSITIDGDPYSEFPEKLSCGTHKVKVEAEGYKTWEEEITITPQNTSTIIDLEKEEEPEPESLEEEEKNLNTDFGNPVNPTSPNPETPVDSTQTEFNASDNLMEETVAINKESHPIRNFFSSLFK